MTKNLSLLILIFLPLGVFAQVAKDSTKAAIKKSIQKEFSKTRIFNLEFDQSFSRSYDSELFKEDFTEGKIAKQQSIDFAAKDRKSTRLNSSHVAISYAVFCLKKKIKKKQKHT